MDRVIFGDNQFFGVDHLSEENARKKEQRFKDTREIFKVLDAAHEVGIRTFMCTTYARVAEICDYFKAHPTKYDDWKIYPCMPYAHKYANAVTEMGIAEALNHFTGGNIIGSAVKGGMAVVKRDVSKMMQMLIDSEMSMFVGTNTEVIFLQNVITDLLMGLGMDEFFVHFSDYVREEYRAEPGFITMNLPMAADRLHNAGLEKPIICASINKIGFRMTGGAEANEATLAAGTVRGIAMQVLAAGALRPAEAMEYACRLDGVESVLFGASSHAHIAETFHLIERLSP